MRREGDVVDGIDFGGERDEVIVRACVRDTVAEHEAEKRADNSDEHALQDEDASDLRLLRAQVSFRRRLRSPTVHRRVSQSREPYRTHRRVRCKRT